MSTDAATMNSAGRIDRILETLGERLNPILVKEARQALKSRQFVVTFGLLLTAGCVWSLLGLALLGPEVFQGTGGPTMFSGYFVILAFPLLVIVPFGAYRSLAGEQEDRTYELLSITDLSPRQIVSGKLGSAMVQMLIYLSAIAPCLAFTYMLRGISLPLIFMMIFYLVLASLGLAVAGLLAGTLTSSKHWHVVLSVVLIVGLLIVFWTAFSIAMGIIYMGDLQFRDPEFWLANSMVLTVYITYFALIFFAAVAQITFASDNRSTRLRIVMAVQHTCLVGWFALFMLVEEPQTDEFFYVFFSMIALHWYVMGALMTGEWAEMSLRVKRRLPQSFLGRVLLTWFSPGPGTGFMFAVGGLLSALVTGGAMIFASYAFIAESGLSGGDLSYVLVFCTLSTCYAIIYLGVGLLLIRLCRKMVGVPLFFAALVQILLAVSGVGVPLIVQSLIPSLRYSEYTLLQIPNPFWTLFHVADNSPVETPILMIVLPLAALVVLVLNLPGVAREVRQVRIVAPQRVVEEDTQLAAEAHPPQPKQISPWDVETP